METLIFGEIVFFDGFIIDLANLGNFSLRLKSHFYLSIHVCRYVESVLAGQEEPDSSVGRALVNLVQSVPKMDPVKFEAMLNSNLRDLLMVIYLSSLTKTQLQLNEKLSMVSVNNIREMSKFLQLE